MLSAGCHSGYNIVPTEAGSAWSTQDWSQRLAQQHALLIGGTGYQYGDSDFLEYSERLYLGIAKRLREGTSAADPAVAVGHALALAKQDYLASLGNAPGHRPEGRAPGHLYGLPMTGFDAPGRAPLDPDVSVAPRPRSRTAAPATRSASTSTISASTRRSTRRTLHAASATARH